MGVCGHLRNLGLREVWGFSVGGIRRDGEVRLGSSVVSNAVMQ